MRCFENLRDSNETAQVRQPPGQASARMDALRARVAAREAADRKEAPRTSTNAEELKDGAKETSNSQGVLEFDAEDFFGTPKISSVGAACSTMEDD